MCLVAQLIILKEFRKEVLADQKNGKGFLKE